MGKWRKFTVERRYAGYFLIVLLFFILQLLLESITKASHGFHNLHWYHGVARQMHDAGFFNIWTPYPPVFAAFLYAVTSLLPDWEDFLLFWKVLNVALVAGISFLVFKIVRESRKEDKEGAILSLAACLIIHLTWNSRITIGFYFDQFDYLPILIMIASLYFLINQRYMYSAIFCGIGTMAKIFPIVILLAALINLQPRISVKYAAVFAATCIVILLPYLLINMEPLLSFYRFSTWRDGWETVWTFPDIRFPPVPKPKYLTMPFNAAGNPYPWLPWITAVSVIACLWWRKRRGAVVSALPGTVLCLLLIVFIFSKGISSYYIFWLFPLLFLVYKPVWAFGVCAGLLLVGNIEYMNGTVGYNTYWISIILRHIMLLGLLAHQIFDWSKTAYR